MSEIDQYQHLQDFHNVECEGSWSVAVECWVNVSHSSGTFSWLRLRLKRCCRIQLSWSAHAFRTLLNLLKNLFSSLALFRFSSGWLPSDPKPWTWNLQSLSYQNTHSARSSVSLCPSTWKLSSLCSTAASGCWSRACCCGNIALSCWEWACVVMLLLNFCIVGQSVLNDDFFRTVKWTNQVFPEDCRYQSWSESRLRNPRISHDLCSEMHTHPVRPWCDSKFYSEMRTATWPPGVRKVWHLTIIPRPTAGMTPILISFMAPQTDCSAVL